MRQAPCLLKLHSFQSLSAMTELAPTTGTRNKLLTSKVLTTQGAYILYGFMAGITIMLESMIFLYLKLS